MTKEEDKEPDLVDFLSDVNMQVLHINKTMLELSSNSEWVERLQQSAQLIGQFDYQNLNSASTRVQGLSRSSTETLEKLETTLSNTYFVRKRFIRQWGVFLATCVALLMLVSAYLGAMYLPGRPSFRNWGCEALGGRHHAQNDGSTICYYVYS